MILLVVLTLIFLVLLLFPFLLARVSLDTDKVHSLVVKNNNLRNPRYFSQAFIALMERGLSTYDGSGMIRLSKAETLLEPPILADEVDALVYAKRDFAPARAQTFAKEIYCKGDARLPAGTALRAIACLGTLTLEEGCTLARWADAEREVAIAAGCALGISVSSGQLLRLAPGCAFRRLYAAEIVVGSAPDVLNPPAPPLCKDILRNPKEIEDLERVEGSIVTMHDLVVGEYAVINGSVKSRGRIHVKKGAHILYNLIADGDLVLEDGVFIGGVVFSQRYVYLGPSCQIGRKGRIKSAVAKCGVTLAEGCRVYGYVSGELECASVEADAYYTLISDKF
ncbi:MAG: hypothetical protein Q4E65_07465 [Clostridia bacterium]|nr:hypothetical protein [Clostridia bacterium]